MRLTKGGCTAFEYHRVAPGDLDAVAKILQSLGTRAVIISTPTNVHVPLALTALTAGCFVAIEKPIASNVDDVARMDRWIAGNGTKRIFVFGYYLLEKALPLLALRLAGNLPDLHLSLMNGPDRATWAAVRHRLGAPRMMRARLLEGPDYRFWPLTHEAGGHTLETLSHLVALAVSWFSDLNLLESRLGRYEGLSADTAESASVAVYEAEQGATVELTAVKFVDRTFCQRRAEIVFDHGIAEMDMDAKRLMVSCTGNVTLDVSMKDSDSYSPQFRLLCERLDKPTDSIEYEISRTATLLSLQLREASLKHGIESYSSQGMNIPA